MKTDEEWADDINQGRDRDAAFSELMRRGVDVRIVRGATGAAHDYTVRLPPPPAPDPDQPWLPWLRWAAALLGLTGLLFFFGERQQHGSLHHLLDERVADLERLRQRHAAAFERHEALTVEIAGLKRREHAAGTWREQLQTLKKEDYQTALAISQEEQRLLSLRQRKADAIARTRAAALGDTLDHVALTNGTTLSEAIIRKITPEAIIFQVGREFTAAEWHTLPRDLVDKFQLEAPKDGVPPRLQPAVEAMVLTELAALKIPPDPAPTVDSPGNDRDFARKAELVRRRMAQLGQQEARLLASSRDYLHLHHQARRRNNISGHLVRSQQLEREAAKIREHINALEVWLYQPR